VCLCAVGKVCVVITCLTKKARLFGGGRTGCEKDTVRTCNSFSEEGAKYMSFSEVLLLVTCRRRKWFRNAT